VGRVNDTRMSVPADVVLHRHDSRMSSTDRPRVNARLGTMVLTQVRFTTRQRSLVDEAAARAGMSRSEYMERLLRQIVARCDGELPAVEVPEHSRRRRMTQPTQMYLAPDTRAMVLREAEASGAGVSRYFELLLEMFVSNERLPAVSSARASKGARTKAA